ncbi:MAG: hypothetical protein KTR31_11440 [Myxococcales bacterium]|nr:hypothetical protein [Myxococcales bacterium]
MAYTGDRYLDFGEVRAELEALASGCPEWVALQTLGTSRGGRPILMVTVGDRAGPGNVDDRPAFWLDGGTHAVEWTGVMSAVATLVKWVSGLQAGDEALCRSFRAHTVYAVPCISPDGLQETMQGAPYFRSTTRPARPGTVRIGFEERDIDDDGVVRWMRWRHPAGPWVADEKNPVMMRPRTVDDDPSDAFFFSGEGRFVRWDGVKWEQAPLEWGLDLNRNFPVDWSPFSMFGMDAGTFPGSEPESRALLDAVAARPNIAAALTNHTYTGCLLTPPSRKDSPIPAGDLARMQRLALDLVEGTGYRTFKVYPDFMYDPDKPIIGTWDDTLSAVFGVVAYTLEFWDPYAWAGIDPGEPAADFRDPDIDKIRGVLDKVVADGAHTPWRPFEHPQLGPVEIGGIDYQRTVRNPPEALLAEECQRGFTVADRLRRALPQVHATLTATPLDGDTHRIQLVLENQGALPTSSLEHAVAIGTSPPVRAELTGAEILQGEPLVELPHLEGWMRHGFGRSPVYGGLPGRGHRAVATWVVRGTAGEVHWWAGRGGRGVLPLQ